LPQVEEISEEGETSGQKSKDQEDLFPSMEELIEEAKCEDDVGVKNRPQSTHIGQPNPLGGSNMTMARNSEYS